MAGISSGDALPTLAACTLASWTLTISGAPIEGRQRADDRAGQHRANDRRETGNRRGDADRRVGQVLMLREVGEDPLRRVFEVVLDESRQARIRRRLSPRPGRDRRARRTPHPRRSRRK
jgi:hypothetical protein